MTDEKEDESEAQERLKDSVGKDVWVVRLVHEEHFGAVRRKWTPLKGTLVSLDKWGASFELPEAAGIERCRKTLIYPESESREAEEHVRCLMERGGGGK